MSWEHWDAGSVLCHKDLALPQLWLSSQLRLGSDPWPGTPCAMGLPKKKISKNKTLSPDPVGLLYLFVGYYKYHRGQYHIER